MLEPESTHWMYDVDIFCDSQLSDIEEPTRLLEVSRDWLIGSFLELMEGDSRKFNYHGGGDHYPRGWRLLTHVYVPRGEPLRLRLNRGRYFIAAHQESSCGFYGGTASGSVVVSSGGTVVFRLQDRQKTLGVLSRSAGQP